MKRSVVHGMVAACTAVVVSAATLATPAVASSPAGDTAPGESRVFDEPGRSTYSVPSGTKLLVVEVWGPGGAGGKAGEGGRAGLNGGGGGGGGGGGAGGGAGAYVKCQLTNIRSGKPLTVQVGNSQFSSVRSSLLLGVQVFASGGIKGAPGDRGVNGRQRGLDTGGTPGEGGYNGVYPDFGGRGGDTVKCVGRLGIEAEELDMRRGAQGADGKRGAAGEDGSPGAGGKGGKGGDGAAGYQGFGGGGGGTGGCGGAGRTTGDSGSPGAAPDKKGRTGTQCAPAAPGSPGRVVITAS